MSPLFIAVLAGFFVLVFSQFGARLEARHSVSWYLVSGFILVAAIRPQWLRPVADLFGIEVISNLVLAVLTMFLFMQMLEQYSESARSQRQLVRLVASLAAQGFPLPATARAAERLRVLVVLPCYNEAESLPHLVPQLMALKRSTASSELEVDFCIINDGSLDASPAVLAELAPANHVSHHTNIGVAGVLRTGFEIARRIGADYVVQCDADGQHPIERIPHLVHTAQARQVDMLIGSRFAPGGGEGDALASTTAMRRLGGLVVSTTLRLFRGARVKDPTSGFRVYSRRAMSTLLRLMPDEYPEPEVIALVALARLHIEETHVTMMPRTTGASSISGLKSARFMTKVTSALLGLRLRTLFREREAFQARLAPVTSLLSPAAPEAPVVEEPTSRARASGE